MRDGGAERDQADGDLGEVSDEELREWVAKARAELAGHRPGGDTDASATRVMTALWLAELATRQGDPRDLEAAIAAVDQALRDDPGHLDAPQWRGILGQLHWYRYEVASDPGMPPQRQADLLVEPVRHLETAAAVLAPGEEITRQVRARLGVAYGARYCCLNDPADLDAAITELGEALDGVPEPMGQQAFFRFHYGRQYARRYDLTGATADCDRALAEIRRAVKEGRSPPSARTPGSRSPASSSPGSCSCVCRTLVNTATAPTPRSPWRTWTGCRSTAPSWRNSRCRC